MVRCRTQHYTGSRCCLSSCQLDLGSCRFRHSASHHSLADLICSIRPSPIFLGFLGLHIFTDRCTLSFARLGQHRCVDVRTFPFSSSSIMAFPTLIVILSVLFILALWKRITASRRHRIPRGLKPLPGPKGTVTLLVHPSSISYSGTIHWRIMSG